MPNMIETTYLHKLVFMRNKLFVVRNFNAIGKEPREVFDSDFKKFVSLQQKQNSIGFGFNSVF